MPNLLGILCYGVVLIFGVFVAALFADVKMTKKNILLLSIFSAAIIIVQVVSRITLGLSTTKNIYPIIAHIPLVLFLIFVLKKTAAISIVSILSAYMLCQFPRWIASAGFLIQDENTAYNLLYIGACIITYILIRRYVAHPVNKFMHRSKRSCLLLGAVPLIYYIFDYATTVYTDMLFMGTKSAVQFMPSVVSIFYFVFVLIYYDEVEKNEQAQRDKDMLSAQIKEARQEMRLMHKMQENAALYRHDMRHHLVLLGGYADEANINKIKEYVSAVTESIDKITPKRFTKNETVNIILTFFEEKAQSKKIAFDISANLPDVLPISDAKICSLLSNAIENALVAVDKASSTDDRRVKVSLNMLKNNLLIEIENLCVHAPNFVNGLPQADKEGHGLGTKSILAIAESYGGQALFNYCENTQIFNLKIIIPLKQDS